MYDYILVSSNCCQVRRQLFVIDGDTVSWSYTKGRGSLIREEFLRTLKQPGSRDAWEEGYG